jgi:hypothetical protein
MYFFCTFLMRLEVPYTPLSCAAALSFSLLGFGPYLRSTNSPKTAPAKYISLAYAVTFRTEYIRDYLRTIRFELMILPFTMDRGTRSCHLCVEVPCPMMVHRSFKSFSKP